MDAFIEREDWLVSLCVLYEASKLHSWRQHAYCLMTNDMHFISFRHWRRHILCHMQCGICCVHILLISIANMDLPDVSGRGAFSL